MTRLLACLVALLLCWPAWAQTKPPTEALTLQLECHPASLVKDTIRSGEIKPVAFAMNADGELVILFAVAQGGYWLGLVIENGERVCGLSAGSSWQAVEPGQAS